MKSNDNFLLGAVLSRGLQEEEIQAAYFKGKGLAKLNMKGSSFTSLQILSLESNNLTDIEFITALPQLFSLNVKNNPVRIFS